MVHVRLAKDWTDSAGTAHSAGDTVDVDAGTLATLEEAGIVKGPDGADGDSWPGPTGGDGDSWPGPTA